MKGIICGIVVVWILFSIVRSRAKRKRQNRALRAAIGNTLEKTGRKIEKTGSAIEKIGAGASAIGILLLILYILRFLR